MKISPKVEKNHSLRKKSPILMIKSIILMNFPKKYSNILSLTTLTEKKMVSSYWNLECHVKYTKNSDKKRGKAPFFFDNKIIIIAIPYEMCAFNNMELNNFYSDRQQRKLNMYFVVNLLDYMHFCIPCVRIHFVRASQYHCKTLTY